MFWPLCVCRHSQRTCRRAASFANLRMKMFLSSRALESPAEHLGMVGICQKRCQKNNLQKKLLNNRKRNRQESRQKNPKKMLKINRTNTNIVKNIVKNIVQQHLTLVFFSNWCNANPD